MRRKFALSLTFFAWLLATGSHWDLVQTFAWIRMAVNHSQTVSWPRAVALTFDSSEMCEVCRAVDEAKQQQGDPALPQAKKGGKVILVCEPATEVVWAGQAAVAKPLAAMTALTPEPSAPPTPPPRTA